MYCGSTDGPGVAVLEAYSSALGKVTRVIDYVLRTTAGCWQLKKWKVGRDRFLVVPTPVVVQAP
jgi:hypothetical protein